MNAPIKHGLAFYGVILSAIHFAAAMFLSKVVPLLVLRPENMVGSGEVKPYWPASRLRDAVEGTGDILSLPASWVYDSWPSMPVAAAFVVFIVSSFLWGFALALLARLAFAHFRVLHEPHVA